MARIVGVDIPRDRHVIVPLTYIYGTGSTTAKKVSANVGVPEDACIRGLTNGQTDATRAEIDKLKVEGDPRHEMSLNIERLMETGSYREIRHRRGSPTHGQDTKNNACTRKGPTKVVADKKK